MSQPATNEIIKKELGDILEWSLESKSRLGYFAALCRRMLLLLEEEIQASRFENGTCVERMMAACVNRYLEALQAYRKGQTLSLAWKETFRTTESRRRLVFQDLLLGLNASINFDLGIAAADVLQPGKVIAMEEDFQRLEEVYCSLASQVRSEIHGISPWLKPLDRLGKRKPYRFAQFNLSAACQTAWKVARDLSVLNPQQRQELIQVLDRRVANLVRLPEGRGFLQRPLIWLARRRESRDVRRNIRTLSKSYNPVSLPQTAQA